MEWTFTLPSDPTARCRLTKEFWLGRSSLLVRGQPARRSEEKGRPFLVKRADGGQSKVFVKVAPFDYVPKVIADDQLILLARPLSPFEHAVSALPIILVFLGGAIGGFTGALGTMANYRVIRTEASPVFKAVGIIAVTALSFLTYTVLAALFHQAIGR
jgi:hypothetical protein